jgi:hypothetical protein
MGDQKDGRNDQTNVKDKKQDGHARFLTPAPRSKWKEPKENGSQRSLYSKGDIYPVGHSVHLPVKASDIAYNSHDQPDEENTE